MDRKLDVGFRGEKFLLTIDMGNGNEMQITMDKERAKSFATDIQKVLKFMNKMKCDRMN